MKKRLALPLFICLVIVLGIFLTSANSTDEYVLYKNDTKFSLPEYPAEELNGEIFVPSSFLIGFDNISYTYFQREQSYYFMNTKTGRYFSASLNINSIIVDGDFVEKTFPLINSTIYVPLEYCADILGLKTETVKDGKTLRIRVTDGSEILTFDELTELFDPAPPSQDDPEKPPVIKPPEQDPPTPPVPSENKTVYLVLTTDETSGLSEMLDTLRAFGERATVMFDEKCISSMPLEVLHAIADNNAAGIFLKEGEGLSSLRRTNESLKLISNLSTCIYTSKTIKDSEAEALKKEGYILWQANVDHDSYKNLNSWIAAEEMYKKALESNSSCVMLSAAESNLNLLMALLGYFSNDEDVVLSLINPAT